MTQNCSNSIGRECRRGGKRLKLLVGGLCMIALCVVIRHYWGADAASADTPRNAPARSDAAVRPASHSAPVRSPAAGQPTAPRAENSAAAPGSAVPAVVAAVNTQRITREDLARDCLKHYGNEVLESMVNKYLIKQECQRRGVNVTRDEVNAEIERMAQRFSIPVDKWLKMLKQERNITAAQYANDIIWPTLALRKLAGERLQVTKAELRKEFEVQYGEMVKARLIAVSDPEKARKLRAMAAAKPSDFGNLAKEHSEDAPSASLKGVIQPIRKHGAYQEIEAAAFGMADGEVSPVITVKGPQYIILLREELIPAQDYTLDQVSDRLIEIIRDRKMRAVSKDVFQELQDSVKDKTVWVWNDPAKRQKMPGVAAIIDGAQITVRALAEECMERHGQETLEGMISRKLLEQACKKQNLAITEKDINEEIARAAQLGAKPKSDGSPDIDAWLEQITKKQGIPLDIYRNDVVWPTVALKKLAGEKVAITDEDVQKGYEANYGKRMRCLAIVLDNERRAQQVFEMARKSNTSKYFGELATQYSVEPGSQALKGEVPPIKKFGGQPILEDEAFSLKPGELSGIIPVGDKFVILRCEGSTEPTKVDFAAVRNDIYQDIHEKKLRLAMAECFENLQQAATIDNYLAGTSTSPSSPTGKAGGQPSAKAAAPAGLPTLRQLPGG